MKYRIMGKTGYKVSEIGFGAWQIGGGSAWGKQSEKDSLEALHTAFEKGVNFIDTAAGYGLNCNSEKMIGKLIKDMKNKNIYVSTKTPPLPGKWPPSPYDLAEERFPENYIRDNVSERLKNLGVEKLDILLLHTWTRAWNGNPAPLKILEKLKDEGKIENIGISTPEHDQNSAIDLMRNGLVDVVEIIYNIFEQEPAAELLSTAKKNNVGLICRVPFDESSLTGKLKADSVFEEGDFRLDYFKGDRLKETVERVEKIKDDIKDTNLTLPQVALLFILDQPSISTVIPGMRTANQALLNTSVSDLPRLSKDTIIKLRKHNWLRAFWWPEKFIN